MSTSKHQDRTKLIKEWAKRLLDKIEKVLPSRPNEAEFRKVVDRELDDFCAEIGSPVTHAEYTLATGTADATFNRLIVEYEHPGTLKRSWDKATTHAVNQVKRYIKGVAEKEHREVAAIWRSRRFLVSGTLAWTSFLSHSYVRRLPILLWISIAIGFP